MSSYYIAVGGPIAAGKSSLVSRLSQDLEIPFLDEFDPNDPVFATMLEWLYTGVENIELLLQTYFISNNFRAQQEVKDQSYIGDRDLIEHFIFAAENLRNVPEQFNSYSVLYHYYKSYYRRPDFYIVLDVDWDNFEANHEYFRRLHTNYVSKLVTQLTNDNIDYVIIDTNSQTVEQVFEQARSLICVKFPQLNN